MFQLIGDLLSPAGPRGRLSILIYHRVMAVPDPILREEMDAVAFERHMRLLATEFNVLTLGEAADRLAKGTLPARAVSITFDDGYADNEQVALPILKRLGLRATFFVSTGFSRGGAMFNDVVIESVRRAAAGTHDLSRLGLGRHEFADSLSRRRAIESILGIVKYRPRDERARLVTEMTDALGCATPFNLMMTPAQIRTLHGERMEIGAHTVHHPILASTSEEEARSEIVESKHRLEEITGAPVTVFAYPNGKPGRDYRIEHVRMVREAGFAAAVSTRSGIASRSSDLFQLPRYGPWERNPLWLELRMMAAYCRSPAA